MKISDKFIKADDKMCDFDNHIQAPYFRKKFLLDFEPQKAEITICGLGFYELYINGVNATKGPLAPYISNTDDICYYDNYDIKKLLNTGENVIGVVLGNGFRNPFGGIVWNFDKSKHRGVPILALCLEAENETQKIELEADESFKTYPSPILFDDLRMGYRYDSRLEIDNWNGIDYDDTHWSYAMYEKTPRGKAKICDAEPIKITDTIYPVSIKHYDQLPFAYKTTLPDAEPMKNAIRKNVYIYDFGVNNAGVTQLHINGTPGQKITIHHGEYMQDGRFSVNNIMFPGHEQEEIDKYLEYGQVDVFICKGGEETFTPRFKYDGFRYAYVEGLKPEQATKDSLVYLVMHSDLKERAGFNCSDSTLNKLQEMVRRSDLSNFYYFPTDCPHREKNGWTGDISVSAEHMLLNLTAEKSFSEYLENVRSAQNMEGALPGIVPTGGWGFAWGNGPAWDSICVNLPYYIYKYTGNKEVIKENASMIMRYLYYISGRRDDDGLIAVGLGDWVDPYECERGFIASPLIFTDSVEVYDIASKASFLFSEIGKNNEAQYANNLAGEMRNAIRQHLINKDNMTVAGDCQTSQAVALEMGLFNDDEMKAAYQRLIEIVHRDSDVNACGMIGLRYLFDALTHAGECDLAYDIITGKSRTCYGYWLENGATTMWEDFNDIHTEYAGSRNHHFLGDVSRWFIQEIAGIKPNPSVDNLLYFELTPHFIKKLEYVNAYYDSVYGRVSCNWNRDGEFVNIMIDAPKEMSGKIILPEGYVFVDGDIKKEIKGSINLRCVFAESGNNNEE